MTPSLPDQAYKFYEDAEGTNNNPLAGYSNASYDVDVLPRGAHPLKSIVVRHFKAGVFTDASVVSTALTDTWSIEMVVKVTEPVFLSPFIFGNPLYNKAGMVGINSMNFVMNVDSTCKRMFSSSNNSYHFFRNFVSTSTIPKL